MAQGNEKSETIKVWLLPTKGSRLYFLDMDKEVLVPLGDLIGETLMFYDIGKVNGNSYVVATNKTGRNLPMNTNFHAFIPSFPEQIVGDVAFLAQNNEGEYVDMNITAKELQELSKSYFKNKQ